MFLYFIELGVYLLGYRSVELQLLGIFASQSARELLYKDAQIGTQLSLANANHSLYK